MIGVDAGLISTEVAPLAGSSNPSWVAKARHGIEDDLELKYPAWASRGLQHRRTSVL